MRILTTKYVVHDVLAPSRTRRLYTCLSLCAPRTHTVLREVEPSLLPPLTSRFASSASNMFPPLRTLETLPRDTFIVQPRRDGVHVAPAPAVACSRAPAAAAPLYGRSARRSPRDGAAGAGGGRGLARAPARARAPSRKHALGDVHTALWMRAERLRRVFQLLFRRRVFFTTKTTSRVGCWIPPISPCRSSSSLPSLGLHGRGRTQGWERKANWRRFSNVRCQHSQCACPCSGSHTDPSWQVQGRAKRQHRQARVN